MTRVRRRDDDLGFDRGKKADRYYVYRLTCLVTKKVYIGKTWNVEKRFAQHVEEARERHPNNRSKLQRDLLQYPDKKWKIEVLCSRDSEQEAYDIERILILQNIRKKVPHYNRSLMSKGFYNPELMGSLSKQVRHARRYVHKKRKLWMQERKHQKNLTLKAKAKALDESVQAEAAAALKRKPPPPKTE